MVTDGKLIRRARKEAFSIVKNDPNLSSLENFKIKNPPYVLEEVDRKIAIFHEPDEIESFLATSKDIDIIFHGHTHRFRDEIVKETHIFNPGECAGFMKGSNKIGIVNTEIPKMKIVNF